MADAPPPSRYSIYERDRRLVVVDNWQAGEPDQSPSGRQSAAPPPALRPIAFDGRATLTTLALYDAKGPRTITLDPGGHDVVARVKWVLVFAAMLFVIVAVFQPLLLLAPLVLVQKRFRARLRDAMTAWLDRMAIETGDR